MVAIRHVGEDDEEPDNANRKGKSLTERAFRLVFRPRLNPDGSSRTPKYGHIRRLKRKSD